MIELRAGRMLERFEPGWVDKIGHLDIVDEKRVLFDRVAHFIGVFCAVGRLRPQVRNRVDDHFEQFMARRHADQLLVGDRRLDENL